MATSDVRAATARLLRFQGWRGRWRTPTGQAWQPALAVEAVLAAASAGVPNLDRVWERSFERYRGRRSPYFDDDLWYLNAWLSAHERTGDPRYLIEAITIFHRTVGGWDETCGGGMWWSSARTYKNAITTELLILAAARLSRLDAADERWAPRAWSWLRESGLIGDRGLVNDGLTAECANNGGVAWTYNQGVILGALATLGEWDRAHAIAGATLRELTGDDGILREPAPPSADGHVFKGVFAQGLGRLHAVDPRPAYAQFLHANAAAAWAHRDPADGIGLWWDRPGGPIDAATQASGVLLLASAASAR